MEKTVEKTYFEEIFEAVKSQTMKDATLTPIEVAERYFSEKYDVAVRMERFHAVVKERGLGFWRECGYMEEDFDVLFEHVERGYSLKIHSFPQLMQIFDKIREMGDVTSVKLSLSEKETCPECEGARFNYDHDECEECKGVGRIIETRLFEGKGEGDYQYAMDLLNPYYARLDVGNLFSAYGEYLERFDEDVDLKEGLQRWEGEKKEKPFCKLIGEDGNVFNLLGIVSKTLKRAGLKEEAKEVADKVWECKSYDESLQLFMKYVDIY